MKIRLWGRCSLWREARSEEQKARQGRGSMRGKIKRARETSAARAPFGLGLRRYFFFLAAVFLAGFLAAFFAFFIAISLAPCRGSFTKPSRAASCVRERRRDSTKNLLPLLTKSASRTERARGRRMGIDKGRKISRVFEQSRAKKTRGIPTHLTRRKIRARDSHRKLTRGEKFFRNRSENIFCAPGDGAREKFAGVHEF